MTTRRAPVRASCATDAGAAADGDRWASSSWWSRSRGAASCACPRTSRRRTSPPPPPGRSSTAQQLREQLTALGLGTAVADRPTVDAAAASGTERVTSPFQTARDDGFRVGARATYEPEGDLGVVDVAGGWG